MSINAFRRRLGRKAGANAERSVSEDGEGLLDSLKKHSGDLMGRVAVSVKEAASSNLLKQAIAARKRGNLAAAFHLAKEEYAGQPDEPEIANFYWEVAVEYQRPAEAVAAVVGLIKKNVIGAHEVATGYWIELSSQVPDAMVDPSTLARMIPQLANQIEEAGEFEDPDVSESVSEGVSEAESGGDERKKQDPLVSLARKMRLSRELALRAAIRGVVDDRNRDLLTGGVAMHVAELARELDPESALVAARFAVDCEDVHKSKRDRLRILIAELDPSDPGINPARNHPLYEKEAESSGLSGDEVSALNKRLFSSSISDQRATEQTAESTDALAPPSVPEPTRAPRVVHDPEPEETECTPIPIDLAAEAPVFVDLKCVPAQPTGLSETMLFVQTESGRRSGIKLDKVQAVAVVEVDRITDVPVVIVDLLMNVRNDDDTPLRIARLRTDEFDPLALMPEESDSGAALQVFLGKLMEYTHAIPLPDPEAALGLVVPRFDSLDAYEQEVLQVRR
jgi:hypothetical protein